MDEGEKGYIDPLLTNVAADWSVKAREGLVADTIFPRIPVTKPSGYLFTYTKEQAYKITDDTMSEIGEAPELKRHGKKVAYSCTPRGNKTFVSKDEEEFKDGPFVRADVDFTKDIITNIERNREIRVRDTILNLTGRSISLTGVGSGKTNKWINDGGNAFQVITEAIGKLFYRPNIMIIPEGVYDVLEFNTSLISKLEEANMIKKINEETLAKLFRINKVVIASGKGDFSKDNKEGKGSIETLWGNNVILGYTDTRKDVPCSGKTLTVAIQGSKDGYVIRKWDEPKKGILGGHEIQVGCYMDEYVIADELLFSIQDVI